MEGHALELEPVGDEERDWLLDGLAVLIRRQGYEHFVSARIVRGRNEDFPDRVPKGHAGARVLIRRLLCHAAMPELRVRLDVYTERTFSELDHRGVGHAGPGTAAWFAGIEDDVCHFGVNARELRDQEDLIGTLAHEVAHAFRYRHGLVVRDAAVEERLTDVTTVYLGFGIFLLNSSKVFKTGGYSEAGDPLLYQTQERGYLAPRQLALLLAAQVVARDLGRKQRAAIATELTPNHRKLFEDACDRLPPPAELRQRLGVPEPSAWPTLSDPDAPVAELEIDDEQPEVEEEPAPEPEPATNARRVTSSLGKPLSVVGGVLALAVGALGVIDGWPLLGATALAAGFGFVVGKGLDRDSCSACRERLPRGATTCPTCSASLVASENAADHESDDEGELDDAIDEPDAADDSHLPLVLGMYAAWVIERGYISDSAEEAHAQLVVAVRCGQRPSEELARAWESLAAELEEPAASFVAHYFGGRDSPASLDYTRLIEGGALRDTPASYARVADLLDSRLAATLESAEKST